MVEFLILQERAKNAIQLGESHFREFKSAWMGPDENKKPRPVKAICKDIGEALVAFANADGGELLIGVEDLGAITGIPHAEQDIQAMIEATQTHVHNESKLPILNTGKINIEEKVVLYFSVAKGSEEVYQLPDGRCVRRKDKETIPETPRRIHFERHEIKSREYDRHFVDGAIVNDLDIILLQNLADNYLRGLSIERYLQQIGVAEYAEGGLRLRMAALLLFAKDIQKWHPRCQVRILKIEGTRIESGENYNVLTDEQVHGNIFELLITSWEKMRPFLAYRTKFGSDARFIQKYIYPEDACREAIVNAIAHRDYCISNGIDVFIFNDRMEIKTPGALLSTLSIEDLEALEGAHESRNSLISRVLRENKFMRELGEGMKRIFSLMEESDLEKPRLHSDSNSFTITLPHKSVYSVREIEWLKIFDNFNLSRLQKKIVAIGIDGREISPDDIYKAMNTDDRDTYDREVTGLREASLLIEIRSNVEANRMSKRDQIPKREITRYKIRIPEIVNPEEISRGVFVANLADSVTADLLRALFEKYGTVTQVKLPLIRKGFGFIWFQNSDSARKAIKELDRFKFHGKEIKVDKLRPRIG